MTENIIHLGAIIAKNICIIFNDFRIKQYFVKTKQISTCSAKFTLRLLLLFIPVLFGTADR